MAIAPNLGTGGSVLDAQFGSSSSSNTNEPLALAHTGENYLYLPGVSGNNATVPDSAALDLTTEADIQVRIAFDDWTPAAPCADNDGASARMPMSGSTRSEVIKTGDGGRSVT